MALPGHKTIPCFKGYNLVTEEELSEINWPSQERKTGMVTYTGTNEKGATSKTSQPLDLFGSGG